MRRYAIAFAAMLAACGADGGTGPTGPDLDAYVGDWVVVVEETPQGCWTDTIAAFRVPANWKEPSTGRLLGSSIWARLASTPEGSDRILTGTIDVARRTFTLRFWWSGSDQFMRFDGRVDSGRLSGTWIAPKGQMSAFYGCSGTAIATRTS